MPRLYPDFIKTLFFILAGLALAWLAACRAPEQTAPSTPTYVTTIHPIRSILQELAEGRAEVIGLLPPAASPHTHEPRPDDAVRTARSLALFYVSQSLDGWAARLDAPEKVELIGMVPEELILEYQDGAHGDGHPHDHSDIDPHFWTDPAVVKAVLPALAAKMSRLDPDGSDIYEANAAAMDGRLSALETELHKTLETVEGNRVLLFHPSFLYLLRGYGLVYAGAIEAAPGKEATPAHIARMAKMIREKNVKAVFTEPQLPVRPAEVVAEAGGVPLYILDPIGGVEGRESYEELMRYNARVLAKALE